MSGLLSGAVFDVKRSARPAFLIAGIASVAFFLAIALAVGIFYFVSGRASPPTSPVDAAIPVTAYAPSVVQVFDCVQTGPTCPYYDKSVTYLKAVVPNGGMTYTPLNPEDPGTLQPNGTKVVLLNSATTPAQWQAVGKAVTLNGAANEKTVTEKSVAMKDAQTATFSVPGSPKIATMRFSITQSTIQVLSVTYADAK